MTEREKMVSGLLYNGDDLELKKLHDSARTFMDLFNDTNYNDFARREELIRETFKSVGDNIRVNKLLHIDYGVNITLGNNFYANFNLTILDVAEVVIGNNVMFGPNVSLLTATHPIDASGRNSGLEYGLPINIGNNVWLGGGVIVNPGVTIGDNTVVGSGSVVTKDLPAGIVAAGNPARIIRKINGKDLESYENMLKTIIK